MSQILKKRGKFCVKLDRLYKFNTLLEAEKFLSLDIEPEPEIEPEIEPDEDYDQQPIPFYDGYKRNFKED